MKNFLILFTFLAFLKFLGGFQDFTLACRPGYKLIALRRVNSAYQRGVAGSFNAECQQILKSGLEQIKCETPETSAQCNGFMEGCSGNQWIAGFHVFSMENSTNAALLDPICCSSPSVRVDSLSCASERLNVPREPFEHRLLANDHIYRGFKCWHQLNSTNTLVDIVWKVEICQYTSEPIHSPLAKHLKDENSCPPCNCHCGIDVCGNGAEPIRIVHKELLSNQGGKCGCDCKCDFECL